MRNLSIFILMLLMTWLSNQANAQYSSRKIQGKWMVIDYSAGEKPAESDSSAYLELKQVLLQDFSINLKKNGVAEVVMSGIPASGKWKLESGNMINISWDSNQEVEVYAITYLDTKSMKLAFQDENGNFILFLTKK